MKDMYVNCGNSRLVVDEDDIRDYLSGRKQYVKIRGTHIANINFNLQARIQVSLIANS